MALTKDEIVHQLVSGNCVMILDGKAYGTLLGELLKRLRIAEEEVGVGKKLVSLLEAEIRRLQGELDKRTPEGLRKPWPFDCSAMGGNYEGQG